MLKAGQVKAEWDISASNRRVRTYRITAASIRHPQLEVSSLEQMLKGFNLVLSPTEP